MYVNCDVFFDLICIKLYMICNLFICVIVLFFGDLDYYMLKNVFFLFVF